MPFPTDPIRAEETRARLRAAQAKRWSRPEEREKARQSALKQFSDPAVRAKMSETKRQYYTLSESRQKTRDGMRRFYSAHPERKRGIVERTRVHREQIKKENLEARLAIARNTEEAKLRRLTLIKQRIKERTEEQTT